MPPPASNGNSQGKPAMPAMAPPSFHGNNHANGNGRPSANGQDHAHESTDESGMPGKSHGLNDLIDEANALKEELNNALSKCSRLVIALRRHRKQSKIVATTLASLRQLQTIDG